MSTQTETQQLIIETLRSSESLDDFLNKISDGDFPAQRKWCHSYTKSIFDGDSSGAVKGIVYLPHDDSNFAFIGTDHGTIRLVRKVNRRNNKVRVEISTYENALIDHVCETLDIEERSRFNIKTKEQLLSVICSLFQQGMSS